MNHISVHREPLEIAMFSRARHTGYYSIEKVFQTLRSAFPPHIRARLIVPPVHAQGWWARLLCLAYAGVNRCAVNHITGDITFVALALPPDHTIVTVHDFDRLYRLSGLRAAFFRLVYFTIPFRRCKMITVISPQIAQELEQLFPWAAQKTVVIPDCLPAGFSYSPKEFCTRQPLILQIGTGPNKNIEALIQALEGQRCELHLVGSISDAQRTLLDHCRICYRNSLDLSEDELRKAYTEADIVSFVSTYEGFGLPIIEANAVGRPVITSNIPPMSQVAGDAACLVDPSCVEAIRQGILRLIGDAAYRSQLVAKGLENVRRYDATQIARQFAALYEMAAAKHANREAPLEPVSQFASVVPRKTS